jgi:hypothetical protein
LALTSDTTIKSAEITSITAQRCSESHVHTSPAATAGRPPQDSRSMRVSYARSSRSLATAASAGASGA